MKETWRTHSIQVYTVYTEDPLLEKFVLTYSLVSDSNQEKGTLNDTSKQLSNSPAAVIPAPSYAAPPAPTIHKDGSVQYDEPIIAPKQPPQVAAKPVKPSLSPLSVPHYHTLEDHTHLSPQSQFPPKPPLTHPSSHQYHSLEPGGDSYSCLLSLHGSSNTLSRLSTTSPQTPSTGGPTLSLDRRTASLNRSLPAHARDLSTSSERQLIPIDPGYDIIQPPRWDSMRALRMTSTTSSLHSHTSSLGDDNPTDHVYHQLTSEEVYMHTHPA